MPRLVLFSIWGSFKTSGEPYQFATRPSMIDMIKETSNSPPGVKLQLATGEEVTVAGSFDQVLENINQALRNGDGGPELKT